MMMSVVAFFFGFAAAAVGPEITGHILHPLWVDFDDGALRTTDQALAGSAMA